MSPVVTLLLVCGICGGFELQMRNTRSFWDSVPLVSQVKSLVQVVSGDHEGAKQTQINFSRSYPPAALIRGVVEHSNGDHDEAKKTWKHLGKTHEAIIDSVPAGGIHYAVGDTERGHSIMKSATRPIGVIGGGVGGFFVGGPVGAAAGGVAGGVAMDGLYTGIESAVHKSYRPNGIVSSVTKLANNELSTGEGFDTVMGIAGDAFAGYTAGIAAGNMAGNAKGGATSLRCKRTGCGAASQTNANVQTSVGKLANHNQRPPSIASSFSDTSSASGGSFSTINSFRSSAGPSIINSPRTSIQILPQQGIALPPSHAIGSVLSPIKNPGGLPLPPISNVIKNVKVGIPGTKVGVQTASVVAGQVRVGSSAHTEPQVDDDDKKRKVSCRRQPEIQNRDEQSMADCVGKRHNEKCKVRCKRDHRPSKNDVTCIQRNTDAEWDLGGARCVANVAVVCRDKHNNPVDWFVMYKLPLTAPSDDSGFIRGQSFLHMSDRTPEEDADPKFGSIWTDWTHDSGWAPIDNILKPIQEEISKSKDEKSGLNFAFFNDHPHPPFVPTQQNVAHAKGVIAKRGDAGFYLVHSLPKFPRKDGRRAGHSEVYGQAFMCVSLSSHTVGRLASDLGKANVQVYSEDQRRSLITPISDAGPQPLPTAFTSLGGQQFESFTKVQVHDVDIWKDLVADYYGEPLLVMTWIRGKKMPSICPDEADQKGILGIENIKTLQYATDIYQEDVLSDHRTTADHSKWAVGKHVHSPLFCLGDLNRMNSQLKRSGQALCFKKMRVADTFREMVKTTECGTV